MFNIVKYTYCPKLGKKPIVVHQKSVLLVYFCKIDKSFKKYLTIASFNNPSKNVIRRGYR